MNLILEMTLDLLKSGTPYALTDLGVIVQLHRKRAGHSQKQAAKELSAATGLKILQPHVSKAERGKSKYTSLLFQMVTFYTDYEVNREPHFLVIPKAKEA